MSILVKGIKMPRDCPQCLLSSWSPITNEFLGCYAVPGKRYAMLDKKYAESSERPDWCPLVELPEKHGRLIDADELKTAFPRCDNNIDIKIASVRATINHMPTVIEAEDKDESYGQGC